MTDHLSSEHEALLHFMYMAPVGLLQTSLNGDITMINPESARLLMPLQRNGVFSNLFAATEMVAPELRNLVKDFDRATGVICQNLRMPIRAGTPGKLDPTVLEISLLKIDEERLMAVLNDVSLIVKREEMLKQSEAWLNALLTDVNDYAVVHLDADGHVSRWDDSVHRLTGFIQHEVLGKSYSVFFPGPICSVARVTDYLEEAKESGWSLHENWCLRKDGNDQEIKRFWSSSMIVPLRAWEARLGRDKIDQHETAYVMIIRDLSDRYAKNASQLHAYVSDHLTGVFNRRAFFDAAELELKRWRRFPRPLSLLMIDADHFKHVNDVFGHAAGDAVLCELSDIIARAVREIDVVARVGGEEFAVLLPSLELKDAKDVAQRICDAIAKHGFTFDGMQHTITVSIGIAAMMPSMESLDALIKLADQALYRAKRNGRNGICTIDDVNHPGAG